MSRTKTIALAIGTLAAGALLATGITGIAQAADTTPSPSSRPSSSTTDDGHHGHGPGRPHPEGRDMPIHGEAVVKAADGTYTTVSSIRGTVSAVSSTSITVKAEDGFVATYVINADTEGADVKVADVVSVRGTVSGSTATATSIHARPANPPS